MQNKQPLRQRLFVNRKLLSVTLAARLALVTVMPAQPVLAAADAQSEPPSTQTVLTVPEAADQWLAGAHNSAYNVSVAPSRTEEAQAAAAAAAKQAAAKRTVVARDTASTAVNTVNRDQVSDLINKYAAKYAVSSTIMHAIVQCESGYNQFAKNSSSTAAGYAQFLTSTWNSTMSRLGYAGVSQYDGDKNIEALAYVLSTQGTRPWTASQSCWAR